MPYIKQARRAGFSLICTNYPDNPGELNYMVTMVVKEFLGDKPNYDRFNAAIGALESAKLELYRRMIAPYEDTKIKENGDVY